MAPLSRWPARIASVKIPSESLRASWGGELAARVGRAPADGLAGGQQLAAGPLGERLHADRVEHVVRGAQLRDGLPPAGSPGTAWPNSNGAPRLRALPGTTRSGRGSALGTSTDASGPRREDAA